MLAMDIGHRFGRIGRRGSDGRPTVAIRLLGQGGDPPDPQVALAALLDIAPGGIAPNGQEVALGLSAFEPQELALLRAAEQAGLTVRHSVPEPVAAAVHYGAVAEGVDRSVLVCDQGATRLDLTVLTVTPDRTVRIVETRSRQLGGDDWDRAVAVDLLRQLPAGGDLRREAERLRHALAHRPTASTTVSLEGEEHQLTLDRQTLDRLVAPLRERAWTAVGQALSAVPDLSAVLLAGGLSATPGTAAALEARLGLTVRCATPELAVVHGLLALAELGPLRILSGPPAEAPPRTTVGAPRLREDPEPAPRWRGDDPEPAESAQPPTTEARRPGAAPGASGSPPSPEPEPPTTHHSPEPRRQPEPAPRPAPAEPALSPPPGPVFPIPDPPAAVSPPDPLMAVPVQQLQAIRRGGHLLVLWAWPADALTARVRWRVETDSEDGTTTPLATGDIHCKRRVYEHDGGLDLPVGRGAVTLTVEALTSDASVRCEEASALRIAAEPPIVEYEPSVRRRLTRLLARVVFHGETGCELPALRIVHGVGRYRPMSIAEGTVVHEMPAQRLSAGTPLTVTFPLPATRDVSWLVCFPADANGDVDIDIRPTALHRLRVT